MCVVVLSRYLCLVVEIMIILSGMFMYLRYNIYKEEEKRFEQNNWYEALYRVKLDAFEEWMQERRMDALNIFLESEKFTKLMHARSSENFNSCLDLSDEVADTLEKFDVRIRNGNFVPMAKFWQTYLDMVQILFAFPPGSFSYKALKIC